MKNLLFILFFFIFFSSCAYKIVHVPESYEGQIIKTKEYVGRMVEYRYEGKYTLVMTTQAIFKVCGNIQIPAKAHCYIRTIPCYKDVHPYIKKHLERKYFSFVNGSGQKEYRIKNW